MRARPGELRRWLTVALVVGILCALPSIVAAWPAPPTSQSAATLYARARASDGIPYQGYAESLGTLGLPSVGPLTDTARLLGDRIRLRAWWQSPGRYRVDDLTLTGERDDYGTGATLLRWDSAHQRVTRIADVPALRLPQPVDLLPPQLGRRLLGGAEPNAVRVTGTRRIAGRTAAQLTVEPHDPRTLVGRVDVWVDTATGLPLRVALTPVHAASPALSSTFLDLRLGSPPSSVFAFQAPPDAAIEDADLAGTDLSPGGPGPLLPDTLAGLPRRREATAFGAASYGRGYAIVAVVPIGYGNAADLLFRMQGPLLGIQNRTDGGEQGVVETPMLTAEIGGSPAGGGYLLVGSVPPGQLTGMLDVLLGGPA
jgi:hypothetical protein